MIALVLAAIVSASSFPGCPAHGDNPTARIQRLDLLKNRSTAPATIDPAITLPAMLAPGNDVKRWSHSDGARITGWVTLVKPGGLESVNCHAKSLAHRDTHIEVALRPNAPGTQSVIVEVTPGWRARMKARGVDWSTHTLEKLKGRCVTFVGWMFLDAEHTNAAETTNPGNPHDWRATAWEAAHPVTAITVDSPSACAQP